MKQIINELYKTFAKYELEEPEKVNFYDFGPTQYELKELSKPVKDISDTAVEQMEFYGEGDEWGTKKEVKYILPRFLEYIYFHPDKLENPGIFSYFKYKLKNSFNNDFFEKDEQEVIKKYFDMLLECNFKSNLDVGYLIETGIILGYSPENILNIWDINSEIISEQIKNLLEHFGAYNYKYPFSSLEGVYIDDNNFDDIVEGIFLGMLENEDVSHQKKQIFL